MKKFNKIFTIIVFVFLYAPIVLLIIASFSGGRGLNDLRDFSFHQYRELFRDRGLMQSMLNSLLIAVLSSLIATVLGTMAAVGIHSMGKKMRSVVMSVTNIPMTNPDIVTGIALALLFVFFGRMFRINNIMGVFTILIAHITFNLPYVILSVMPKLRQLNKHLTEAALDLGCPPAKAFFKVVLPEIMPSITSGGLMAFTMSLDDFVISYFVSGATFETLPVQIYTYTKKPLPGRIYALFAVLFTLILLVMLLMNLLQLRETQRRNRKLVMPTNDL